MKAFLYDSTDDCINEDITKIFGNVVKVRHRNRTKRNKFKKYLGIYKN